MTTDDPAHALADEWHEEACHLLFMSCRKDTPALNDEQRARLEFLFTLLSPRGSIDDVRHTWKGQQ